MGIDIDSARLLFGVRRGGASFESVLTLGRQQIFAPSRQLQALASEYGGLPVPPASGNPFAEFFFRHLGAEHTDSLDVSSFEQCSLLHDLNHPVPLEWHERYTLVFDGGTLEHVFNFPQALANCMALTRPGGHFVSIGPANNYCGHGFYQFSPELYCRSLQTPSFRVRSVLLWEKRRTHSRWYRVSDPSALGSRVNLRTSCPVLICAVARKESTSASGMAPYQSDYAAAWVDGSAAFPSSWKGRLRKTLSTASPALERTVERIYVDRWICTFRNRSAFQPVNKKDCVL